MLKCVNGRTCDENSHITVPFAVTSPFNARVKTIVIKVSNMERARFA